MGKLDGKVAFITGGAQGMGASHVRTFVEEGAKVVFSDVLVDKGQALAKELGGNAKFIKHDVTKKEEWKDAIDEAESTFGPVNILVNNAGIDIFKSIEEFSEEEFRKIIDINLIGLFLGMKTVLPSMKKTGNGSIVNISSIDGIAGTAGNSAFVELQKRRHWNLPNMEFVLTLFTLGPFIHQ